jgi:hypothetical protein
LLSTTAKPPLLKTYFVLFWQLTNNNNKTTTNNFDITKSAFWLEGNAKIHHNPPTASKTLPNLTTILPNNQKGRTKHNKTRATKPAAAIFFSIFF